MSGRLSALLRSVFLAASAVASAATDTTDTTDTKIYTTDTTNTRKPHVILVVGDDVGYYNLGYFGNTEVKTPAIDGLATGGARFDRMYAYFWCSPSRASLMSGRFPAHVYQTSQGVGYTNDGLPLQMTTLAEKMRSAGYRTIQAGKWHLGQGSTGHMPISRGFDSSLGFLTGAENHVNQSMCSDGLCLAADGGFLPLRILAGRAIHDLWHDHAPGNISETDTGTFGDDRWTNHVIEAIDATTSSSKPLFAYLTLAAAHTPLQAPDAALAPYPETMYHDRRLYNGLITSMDTNIGRLVSALEQRDMWSNTLLWFTSDNGGPIYWNNAQMSMSTLHTGGGANNHPLSGGKITLLEGGFRVPSFAAGGALPAAARATAFPQLAALADIHATLADLAGASIPDPRGVAAGLPAVDGVSLLPVLRGASPKARDFLPLALNVTMGNGKITGLYHEASAIMLDDLKLIVGDMPMYYTPPKVFPTADYSFVWDSNHTLRCGRTGCLFNVSADPSELHDLAPSSPDLLRMMHGRLRAALPKRYEHDPRPKRMVAFALMLRRNKGFIGPFAEDGQLEEEHVTDEEKALLEEVQKTELFW